MLVNEESHFSGGFLVFELGILNGISILPMDSMSMSRKFLAE
jgi:hypothetical protein